MNKTRCKRTFDIVSSSLGLVICSPIFLATALAIKLSDKGQIIYKQDRLTKDNRIFEIYKFRSMRVGGEDEEVTDVGEFIRKYHIDELPQFFNILAGDMSMVGPRPERPELAKEYCEEIPEFDSRLQVKAGLTGYAQVYCKNNEDPREKLKYDLIYINKMSLLMNLKLIFATVGKLFRKEDESEEQTGKPTK